MQLERIFSQLGFSAKTAHVFEALLRRGPSSVRILAAASGINRGTVYEALKILIAEGLVSYYEKEKKQFFVAEEPERFHALIQTKQQELEQTRQSLEKILPELESLRHRNETKSSVRFYESAKGVRMILQDVLNTIGALPKGERLYRVYSALDIRPSLYTEFINYTEERIKRGIKVKVLSVFAGGEEPQLAERKILARDINLPTYTIIYANRCAFISLRPDKQPHGAVIEDNSIAKTQRLIFEILWSRQI